VTTELLEAMRVATETGARDDRLAVVRALSAGEVVVPLLEEDELWTVSGRDGRPVGLAFTDLDAFRNWRTEGAWASLYGHELAAMLLDGGARSLIINVHGPFGGELDERELDIVASGSALELAAYADGVAQLVLTDGDGAELTVVGDAPADLCDAVVEAAAAAPEVVIVYLLRFATPGSSHLAAGVRTSAPTGIQHFLTALRPLLPGDQALDVIELAPEQLDALAKVEPLYRSP
jgi:hypothetical protein